MLNEREGPLEARYHWEVWGEEEEGGWCSLDVRDGYGVGLWKTIRELGSFE